MPIKCLHKQQLVTCCYNNIKIHLALHVFGDYGRGGEFTVYGKYTIELMVKRAWCFILLWYYTWNLSRIVALVCIFFIYTYTYNRGNLICKNHWATGRLRI